jgi:hypothetical protein
MSNTVLATVVIVGGSTALRVAYDPKVQDKPTAMIKVALGGFVFGAMLTLLSGAAPGLATAIAWLLIVAALMLNGQAIMTATNNVFRK